MTTLFLIGAVVAALFGGGWFLVTGGYRRARKQGRVEAELEAERGAREVEHEMQDVVGKPRDADATSRKLRDGRF